MISNKYSFTFILYPLTLYNSNSNSKQTAQSYVLCACLLTHLSPYFATTYATLRIQCLSAGATAKAIMSALARAEMPLRRRSLYSGGATVALPHIAITPGRIMDTLIATPKGILITVVITHPDTIHVTAAVGAGSKMRRDLVIVVCRSCCRGDDDAHHEDHAHKAHQPTKL